MSPEKWFKVRKELEENQLTIPYTRGMAHNKKTGYALNSEYDESVSRLIIQVVYPGVPDQFEQQLAVKLFLDTIFETAGALQVT